MPEEYSDNRKEVQTGIERCVAKTPTNAAKLYAPKTMQAWAEMHQAFAEKILGIRQTEGTSTTISVPTLHANKLSLFETLLR